MFAGKPDEAYIASFKRLDSDGVEVYVHPKLKVDPTGLVISLEKRSFLRRLQVSGVSVG